MVNKELMDQPKSEHVVFILGKESKLNLQAGITAAMTNVREPFVAFNLCKDKNLNQNHVGAISDAAADKLGVFDTRHNTSSYFTFRSACSFTISQRALEIQSAGNATLIKPMQNSRGNGKRRGSYGGRGHYSKRGRY